MRSLLFALCLSSQLACGQPLKSTSSASVVSKATQALLIAEAKLQRQAAIDGELSLIHGGDFKVVEKPLYDAFHRWEKVAATDLVKSAFMGCATAVSDMIGLAQEIRNKKPQSDFANLKRRYLKEDFQQCNDALARPDEAFRGLLDLDPQLRIE